MFPSSVAILRNHWYIACRSAQLRDKPLARQIANAHLVVFRGPDGQPGALEDRCAHRNLQLSLGQIDEHGLRCAYHGWTWGRDGFCTRIPAAPATDSTNCAKIRVRSFPTVEKQGFVWVHTGDSEPPGPPLDFPHFDEPGWHHWVMEREFEGHAFHCVENFLDVPHTNHVHAGLFRGAESKDIEIEITSGEDWVQAEFFQEERMESLIGRLLIPSGARIVHTDRFTLPYVTRVDYVISDRRQYVVMSQCTPITDERTRVFTYMAYRFEPFGGLVKCIFAPLSHRILDQDVVIIRQQTESLRKTGKPAFVYHETDAIAAAIRDLLQGKSLAGQLSRRRKLRV